MKLKNVDLTPLMGIGGWAIDVIEKAIPDSIGIVHSAKHRAWFLWDFYPTAFLGVHLTHFWAVFEDRLPWELAEEVIVKPFKALRFERSIASMISYFEMVKHEMITPEVFIEDLIKQYEELKDKKDFIEIPILWKDGDFVGTFIWGGEINGFLKPVSLEKIIDTFYLAISPPKNFSEKDIPENDKHWEVVIQLFNPSTNQYETRGISLVAFQGESFEGADDIATIREEMLESFKQKFEENPDIEKAIETMLMGTKWFNRFKKLQKEMQNIKI